MSKAVADIQGTRKAPGVDHIYLPGQREHLALVERRERGIPLNSAVFDELNEIGVKYNLSLPRAA
jgi:LDH2 family malate/lactate/ureidoglycolate dehydrogenase